MDEANEIKREKGTWGGRRPRAGAPKGNINGLKTGEHSALVREIYDQMYPGECCFIITKKGGKRILRKPL